MSLSNKNRQSPDTATIARKLRTFGVQASSGLCEQVRRYMDLLLIWNQKINMTSLTDPMEILERHFGESMFVLSAIPILGGRLADVGTGAGFPGLALKLATPALSVDLIESNGKKAVFLREIIRSLGLQGVRIIQSRAENFKTGPAFNWITARAVRGTPELLGWAVKSLLPGGGVLLWVGDADAERIRRDYAAWDWQRSIPIPRSSKRVLLIGSPP